jgi:molecular chaperone GrpE
MSPTPPPDTEVSLDTLAEKLDYLSGLFERRLLSDKERARAYTDLQARLERAEAVADGMHVVPLARELFVVVDRLDAHIRNEAGLAASVRDELLEALRRHGIDEVVVTSEFDAQVLEVVETVPCPAGGEPGAVVGIVRRGFVSGRRVIRPAGVRVAIDDLDER